VIPETPFRAVPILCTLGGAARPRLRRIAYNNALRTRGL